MKNPQPLSKLDEAGAYSDLLFESNRKRKLFNKNPFHYFKNSELKLIEEKISKLTEEDFSKLSTDKIVHKILTESRKKVPKIFLKDIYLSKPEDTLIKSPIKHNNQNTEIQGTKITIFIPFKGNSELLNVAPCKAKADLFQGKDIFMSKENCKPEPSYGIIEGNTIKVVYRVPSDINEDFLITEFSRNLEIIKKSLHYLNINLIDFNERLPNIVKFHVKKRKEKLDQDLNVAVSFGYEIVK